jgi:hypothetical protein
MPSDHLHQQDQKEAQDTASRNMSSPNASTNTNNTKSPSSEDARTYTRMDSVLLTGGSSRIPFVKPLHLHEHPYVPSYLDYRAAPAADDGYDSRKMGMDVGGSGGQDQDQEFDEEF